MVGGQVSPQLVPSPHSTGARPWPDGPLTPRAAGPVPSAFPEGLSGRCERDLAGATEARRLGGQHEGHPSAQCGRGSCAARAELRQRACSSRLPSVQGARGSRGSQGPWRFSRWGGGVSPRSATGEQLVPDPRARGAGGAGVTLSPSRPGRVWGWSPRATRPAGGAPGARG